MGPFKVRSLKDSNEFVATQSFVKLCHAFQKLKTERGHFIHIVGTPGTGKSANIYNALHRLDLDVYEAYLFMDSVDLRWDEVYKIFWDTLMQDLGVNDKEEIYEAATKYDVVLFADPFLDSEFLEEDKLGLSLWTEENGLKAAPFFIKVFREFLRRRHVLKKVNVITQTAWTIRFKGVKYDLLTDFPLISPFLLFILGLLFEVVHISYTRDEMVQIVHEHAPQLSLDEIDAYIDKYGHRPRFIFEALEEDGVEI